jgi:ABC-2 type transport system permease protein
MGTENEIFQNTIDKYQNKAIRLLRILSLIKKESLQIVRDPSSILIAVVLPLVLLFLFAYGVSLDLNNINLGVVVEDRSAEATNLLHSFQGSQYFKVRLSRDRRDLEPLLVGGRLNAILIIPSDFTKRLYRGDKSLLQVLIRGTDANTGELVLNYIEGALRTWLLQQEIVRDKTHGISFINVEPRVWYNEEIESRAALLPGSIAVIITLIGTMLTSLVVAREWERGTMEALLATPVTRGDLLLGKFIPYYMLGMLAIGLVTVVSTWVMGVPLHGSIWLLFLVSSAFLTYALGLGLFISTVSRSQFVATQVALIVGFLPALILSGLVFEISSMPLPIKYLTYLFAPRYFVTSLRTLFLSGNIWEVIIPNTVVMICLGAFFIIMVTKKTPKMLE